MSKKLVLIDGNSIINRAFFGIPDLTDSRGRHTNAIYGFLNIMFSILAEEEPDSLVVAFDVHEPTFRHKMYEAYKGTRRGMPDELREQVPLLKQLLCAMNIKIMEKGGLEADDILGTLAKRAEASGYDVTIVSGDRDLLQIATDRILVRIPKTKGGRTEIENYHAEDVVARYGLTPAQIIELKGLMGDASDNIPGVPKIGEKTATELLKQYHTIDDLKDHIQEITKKSIRETLTEHFDMAVLSKKLATIETNADIDLDVADARLDNIYTNEAYILVKELGFKNMLDRFKGSAASVDDTYQESFSQADDMTKVEAVMREVAESDAVAFFICEAGLALTFSKDRTVYIPASGPHPLTYLCDNFTKAVAEGSANIITFDLKSQLSFLPKLCECDPSAGRFTDLCIGAYLCNPLKNDYSIEDVANEYCGIVIKSASEIFGKNGLSGSFMLMPGEVREYACTFSYICHRAFDSVTARIGSLGMTELYRTVEMPLISCLYDMERLGIRLDGTSLKAYGETLDTQLFELENEIKSDAGEDFNINSPVQLGDILFVKMGIPGGKKTKKGYSTAADVLEKLAPEYPFVSKILKYRAIAKLRSTYTDALIDCVGADGRIHSTFNQTITATGRISSTEPNLQNIPARMEQGRLIRKFFVPDEGCVFVDADYSQIELRIMAHMSKDPSLIEAFNSGADIHSITAAKVFHVPEEEVTPIMRRNAKAVNFGIIYGISAFGLSEDLNISRSEAKQFIEEYFATFPKVKEYLDSGVERAKKDKYVVTEYSRRRPLPELSSSNFMQRSFGERVAMNAPIQGTAADIMKIAMIRVKKRLEEEGMKTRVILQVHDELLAEAPVEEAEKAKRLLKEEMEQAAILSVPLIVETSTGSNWYEAK
ncbi:MAG: DNA polymerase I [Lachnospiraceae bacterium]|nr:DNA polymerase I [Lachnospiraceae bacterium]